MSLKKESNSFFSSVLVSCIYLSICFFMQYGITDFICTFFSVHVLFLKLYAQFFFFPSSSRNKTQIGFWLMYSCCFITTIHFYLDSLLAV